MFSPERWICSHRLSLSFSLSHSKLLYIIWFQLYGLLQDLDMQNSVFQLFYCTRKEIHLDLRVCVCVCKFYQNYFKIARRILFHSTFLCLESWIRLEPFSRIDAKYCCSTWKSLYADRTWSGNESWMKFQYFMWLLLGSQKLIRACSLWFSVVVVFFFFWLIQYYWLINKYFYSNMKANVNFIHMRTQIFCSGSEWGGCIAHQLRTLKNSAVHIPRDFLDCTHLLSLFRLCFFVFIFISKKKSTK